MNEKHLVWYKIKSLIKSDKEEPHNLLQKD